MKSFFKDPDFDYEFRCALGDTAHGVGDPGTWLVTAESIVDGDRPSWFAAWTARGDEFAALAPTLTDPTAAAWAWRTASAAYSRALGAIDGMPDDSQLLPTFRRSRECWDAMIDLGPHERIEIPYEDTTLPGYLIRPDASGERRPTLVITNGSDGALTSVWAAGVAGALERGWNAVVYDGPGQQSMLFERNVAFRPDWEAVLTPVVDALVARSDVGPLLAYGISQAGYWLPRALAFEHRFAAAVADPGVLDVSTSWTGQLPKEMIALLDSGQREVFDGFMAQVDADPATARTLAFRARPYGITDPFDLFIAVRGYQLRAVADRIRTPLLLTDPEGEQFWPGQSEQLADLLTCEHEVVRFTAADGADLHCQPLAPGLSQAHWFSWLTKYL
jgi:hypothetical protein